MELVGSLLRFSLYPCFETMKRSDNEGEGGWVEDATNKKKKSFIYSAVNIPATVNRLRWSLTDRTFPGFLVAYF